MAGLFALGSNGSGQLGIGHKEDVSVPKPVLFHCTPPSAPIVKVAAGGNHTIVVTESGKAYWSGDSSKGACGITTIATADNAQFEELVLSDIETLGPIAHVACTWDTSTFVVKDANDRASLVYSCGTGEQGQLGFKAQGIVEPTLIPDFPPPGTEIVQLAGGLAHVVAVLDNGEVYGWGNGRKGQLGQSVALDDASPPVPIVLCAPCKIGSPSGVNFKVFKAVCGQYSTCVFGEPGEGKIQFLGPDKWNMKSGALSSSPNLKTVGGSWGSIYTLKQDGTLVAWGRDDHGQLPPANVPKIKNIATGSEHVVALTEDDEVIAWGWGEHGNCGPQADGKFGDVKGRWNIIASSKNLPEGSRITAIGAGCATSWIYITAEGVHL
ncbi:regulator of chromosome condensation 1/beta-lactamase-inhibitor protein II [Pseudomassariella vexata]|uniref:Regulator of chromosome condensation 1/beta-lactamase-inhibitor protein II n=1 Tax=Pseudomassariella vexata TaxID=1141098 RepID=A0A1Y2EAD6_9PEZI|nr:regulator of chromosome condensation 1/beta-lactamase-inhibitor protein II [Pseudomassariella vexata]ORY68502.1 regulator of chromosome condensation 1/beta-lactamase-inhibitor protein II [Pseudomassariella vexata]